MNFKQVISGIAPTVATVLGGPLAGLAVEAVGKAFGMSDATAASIQKALTQGQLTSDQIIALKQAEAALTTRLRELDIQEEQLSYADTDSARKMQMAQPSMVPPMLAILVVGLVCVAEGTLLFGAYPTSVDPVVLGRILGTLDSALMLVLSFYFGSSHSSARKTELLAQQRDDK